MSNLRIKVVLVLVLLVGIFLVGEIFHGLEYLQTSTTPTYRIETSGPEIYSLDNPDELTFVLTLSIPPLKSVEDLTPVRGNGLTILKLSGVMADAPLSALINSRPVEISAIELFFVVGIYSEGSLVKNESFLVRDDIANDVKSFEKNFKVYPEKGGFDLYTDQTFQTLYRFRITHTLLNGTEDKVVVGSGIINLGNGTEFSMPETITLSASNLKVRTLNDHRMTFDALVFTLWIAMLVVVRKKISLAVGGRTTF